MVVDFQARVITSRVSTYKFLFDQQVAPVVVVGCQGAED